MPVLSYRADADVEELVEADVVAEITLSPYVDSSSSDPPACVLRCHARGPLGVSPARCTALLVGLSAIFVVKGRRGCRLSSPSGVCTAASAFGMELLQHLEQSHGFKIALSNVKEGEFPWTFF